MSEKEQSFSSHIEWINKASSWLGRSKYCRDDELDRRKEANVTCFDIKGRVAYSGKQFMEADKESTYPIRFFNDAQVAEYFANNPEAWNRFLKYQDKYWFTMGESK
jgi:hypothetical protein